VRAMRATFFGLPEAQSLLQKLPITGLSRLVTSAALTQEGPPQTVLLSERVPLSRLSGATPASAATCLRLSCPSSRSSESS
jgi:hypothetical protein